MFHKFNEISVLILQTWNIFGAKVSGPPITWSGVDSFIDMKMLKRLRKYEEFLEKFQMVKMQKRFLEYLKSCIEQFQMIKP
jgi:hypothetical protein